MLSHVLPLFVRAAKTKDSLFQHVIIIYIVPEQNVPVCLVVCVGGVILCFVHDLYTFGFKENAFPYEQALAKRGLFPAD